MQKSEPSNTLFCKPIIKSLVSSCFITGYAKQICPVFYRSLAAIKTVLVAYLLWHHQYLTHPFIQLFIDSRDDNDETCC